MTSGEDEQPAGPGPLESGPLESGPLESGPLESGPLESGPLESGPLGPVPAVRAVARVGPPRTPTARGRATVAGAIDPALRSAPPYVPPPPRSRTPAPPATAPAEPEAKASAVEKAPGEPEAPEKDDGPGPSAPPPAPNPDVRSTPRRTRGKARSALLPVAAALVAAFVAATGYLMIQDPPATDDVGRWTGALPSAAQPSAAQPSAVPSAAPPSTVSTDVAPFAVPVDGSAPDPFGTRTPAPTGVPTRLKVPAIGVETSLEALRTGADGEVTAPKSFAKAGWYADGTLPGDTGPAVIAGHVDSRAGPAVFYKLRELARGDRIEVVRGGRTLVFTVTAAAWYPKNAFPTDEVYAPTPDRQLRLITCGGVFDHTLRSYKDNLVVYAVAG